MWEELIVGKQFASFLFIQQNNNNKNIKSKTIKNSA